FRDTDRLVRWRCHPCFHYRSWLPGLFLWMVRGLSFLPIARKICSPSHHCAPRDFGFSHLYIDENHSSDSRPFFWFGMARFGHMAFPGHTCLSLARHRYLKLG